MKSLYLAAAAALLMASTAAQAGNGISFQVEGQKVRIEQPRGCNSLSCLQISAPGLSAKSFNLNNVNLNGFKSKSDDDDEVATTTPAQPAPQAAPAAAPAPAPAPVVNAAPPAPLPPPPAPVATYAAPTTQAPAVTPPPLPPAPQVATAAPAPQVAPAPAPAAVATPTTPVGIWATEDNKGNVRIENCGQNLCGYAEKTGEHILINMKPDGNKWTGRIHDPDGGGNYDSTIAMKGPNVLKVQGCAFGGMFCGGQTWKRIS
jgi:uncharacterized protein (DUF2147 family)